MKKYMKWSTSLLVAVVIINIVVLYWNWNNVSVYRSEETGFTLKIPALWQKVGYRVAIAGETRAEGVVNYNFYLTAKSQASFTVSVITAIPTNRYPLSCDNGQAICTEGEEIGRNNKYVFVSNYFSPEAYGECLDNAFYDHNNELCDHYYEASYPEKVPGVFATFNI